MGWVMTKLRVPVTFSPGVGYISNATYSSPRSLTALRRKVLVDVALRRRVDEGISVVLDLDASAKAAAQAQTAT